MGLGTCLHRTDLSSITGPRFLLRLLGSAGQNVVPLPGSLSISRSAPCRCATPYTIARPSPVPRSPLVVKNGSRQRRRVSSSMPMPVSVTSSRTRRAVCAVLEARAQRQRAAFRHRVEGVENEVDQRLAHLALDAQDHGRSSRVRRAQLDRRRRAAAACRSSGRASGRTPA